MLVKKSNHFNLSSSTKKFFNLKLLHFLRSALYDLKNINDFENYDDEISNIININVNINIL